MCNGLGTRCESGVYQYARKCVMLSVQNKIEQVFGFMCNVVGRCGQGLASITKCVMMSDTQ